ncbi:MAG: STAS domain-containing protein [Phycisphaeraceae bacterium]|nr:STAS domain-containing protein [Phycisphaeraceae bacterium]
MSLTISKTKSQSSAAIFVLKGELNNQTSGQLNQAISNMLDAPATTLVLDMKEISFISSTGIGVIVKTRNTLKQKGSDLTMVNIQPQVKRVFDIMQLTPILKVCENQEELDTYLTTIQNRIIEDGTSISSQ